MVSGGTGFVGRSLVARLAQGRAGEVRVWGRRVPEWLPPGARFEQIDLRDAEAVDSALPLHSLVVNLAYSRTDGRDQNLTMAVNLAAACLRRSCQRLVHVSTAVVVGRVRDEWVTEETPCRPADGYQRTKLEIEERLRDLAAERLPLVILRPTAVFGWGGANLRKLTGDLLHGTAVANYVRSSLFGRRATHLVPVETVTAAIDLALRSPRALQHDLYLVADDEAPENDFRQLERSLREGLGLPGYRVPPVPVPSWCLEALLRLGGRLALRPRTRFSSARLRSEGFVPPLSLRQALEAYVARVAAGRDAPR